MKTKLTLVPIAIGILISGFLYSQAQDWTWLEDDNLPYAREGLSVTELEGSIYFSGGKLANGTYVNIIDIYDIDSSTWDAYESETPGRMMSNAISANGMVFIAGGNRWPGGSHYAEIDVYNKAEDEWTVEYLSEARHLMGVTALGNKVFFAGGGKFQGSPNNILYDVIDIYDTETGLWDTAYLSIPRWLIGAAAAGSKVFFAGGTTGINEVTDVVDVYDTETGLWDTVYLSQARAFTAAVAFGDSLVCFAGGSLPNEISSDVIDIYNVNTGVWTVEYLSEPRVTSALNVKDALVFTGLCYFVDVNGMNIGSSNGTVDIYYPETGQWNLSVPDLNPSRNFLGFTSYDNMAYYAGGSRDTGTPTDVISILEYHPVQTIHVPGDQPTIQAAINYAMDGDTVLVDEGTYYENIDFNGKNIVVGSLMLTTGDTSYISQTVIDGNQNGSVVTFDSGEDSTAVLCGFTITNGSGKYMAGQTHGGGIFLDNHSCPYLLNLIVCDNIAESANGAGICCWGNNNCKIENVTVIGNDGSGNAWTNDGSGGILLANSSPVLKNVNIINNVGIMAGGLFCSGNYGAKPILINVTIAGNKASGFPGWNDVAAMVCWENVNPVLINTILWNDSLPEILLRENSAITVAYSDIQGGLDSIVTFNNDTLYWLDGNINSDPLFVGTGDHPFALTAGSPCIDMGWPAEWVHTPLKDLMGYDRIIDGDGDGYSVIDMGAYEYSPVAIPPLMDYEDKFTILNTKLYNSPNPFNHITNLNYFLDEPGLIVVTIFDISGKVVSTVMNEYKQAGSFVEIIDGSALPKGIYFCILKTNQGTHSAKLIKL